MLSLYVSVVLLLLFSTATTQDFPFRNTSLPWDERVEDLVSRLTFDEIVMQLARGGRSPTAGPAPAIPRLGIRPYTWNTECLSGDSRAGPATSFPMALGLAATFSTDAVFRMAEATGLEVRAKNNNYTAHDQFNNYQGLSCFSPVINIARHPLWGRTQETYGEDPYLAGQLAVAFVQGLQGGHPRYVRANAGCKHFDVHGGPENIPVNRLSFNAQVTDRDWKLTYQPAFETCVKAGTYNIMCSYNAINGVPSCANSKLLIDILRTEWGFKGYVISDQDAVLNVYTQHHYLPDAPSTAAACLKAGCNLELVTDGPNNTYTHIPEAVDRGLIDNLTVIESVKPLFYTRMRLGEFDPVEMNPYASLKPEDFVQSPAHQALALEIAMKSFVLLQNKNNVLPLKSSSYNVISVVGPFANEIDQLYGDYAPDIDASLTVTVYDGLKNLAKTTNLAPGCNDTQCEAYDSASVKDAVTGVELIFVCLGTGTAVEREEHDRADMNLPGKQADLLKDVIDTNDGHSPIVMLLFNGGPLAIDSSLVASVDVIMECFFPAQSTGEAIRRIILNEGDFSNPAGRLPMTWEKDLDQAPDITNYTMVNRTYRYWDQDPPAYPFGYGLSYTTFSYSDLTVTPSVIHPEESVTVEARITNTGKIDGDEVVQVYIAWMNATEPMPKLQLVHFDRILIPSGSTQVIQHIISPEQMSVYEDEMGLIVRPGVINVYVGGQQPDQEISAISNVLHGQFVITA